MGWLGKRRSFEHSASRQPVLGTVATLQCLTSNRRCAQTSEHAYFDSLERDERRFSVFHPESELSRWRRGDVEIPSRDLVELLEFGAHWMARSGGVLNPAVGVVADRWKRAANDGTAPDRAELAELVRGIREPRYRVRDDRAVERLGSCAELTFHSLAKGYLVDRAAAAAFVDGVRSAVANVGGDLVHIGDGAVVVNVEDPLRPYDNAEPIASVRLCRGAMATSGGSRRRHQINGEWFSHIIDPRSGWPVKTIASASVVARSCVEADAIATVLSVLDPEEGLAFASGAGVAALVVDAAGAQFANEAWRAIEA